MEPSQPSYNALIECLSGLYFRKVGISSSLVASFLIFRLDTYRTADNYQCPRKQLMMRITIASTLAIQKYMRILGRERLP
jgi:hypothetical protein